MERSALRRVTSALLVVGTLFCIARSAAAEPTKDLPLGVFVHAPEGCELPVIYTLTIHPPTVSPSLVLVLSGAAFAAEYHGRPTPAAGGGWTVSWTPGGLAANKTLLPDESHLGLYLRDCPAKITERFKTPGDLVPAQSHLEQAADRVALALAPGRIELMPRAPARLVRFGEYYDRLVFEKGRDLFFGNTDDEQAPAQEGLVVRRTPSDGIDFEWFDFSQHIQGMHALKPIAWRVRMEKFNLAGDPIADALVEADVAGLRGETWTIRFDCERTPDTLAQLELIRPGRPNLVLFGYDPTDRWMRDDGKGFVESLEPFGVNAGVIRWRHAARPVGSWFHWDVSKPNEIISVDAGTAHGLKGDLREGNHVELTLPDGTKAHFVNETLFKQGVR